MKYINNRDIEKLAIGLKGLSKRLPALAGDIALETFDGSFKRQGWIERRSLKKWMPRKNKDRSRAGKRAILIKSGRMRRATRKKLPGKKQVAIINDTPYARAHNEGATIQQEIIITKKMRKYFWAMYYETQDDKWKAMALMKKPIKRKFQLPGRQFMGVSPFLEDRIIKNIEAEIKKIFKSI